MSAGGGGWGVGGYLCPPASVDECADRLVRPGATAVQVGAVPRFNQPHKVGTFTLDEEESEKKGIQTPSPLHLESRSRVSFLFLFFFKEQDVNG